MSRDSLVKIKEKRESTRYIRLESLEEFTGYDRNAFSLEQLFEYV